MFLNRRSALILGLSALATPALIRPASAACTYPNVGVGIAFKRKDGSRGIARRESDGAVVIDYVTNRGFWIDRRRVQHGVFETSRIVEESEEPIVGSSPPKYTWSFSPKTSWPEDGMTWDGTVKEMIEVTISDEAGTVDRSRTKWKASYRCFEPRKVSLSGCEHDALTVEATFSGKGGSYSQRWVYFPRIGLGLETRRDGVANGIVAMTPV